MNTTDEPNFLSEDYSPLEDTQESTRMSQERDQAVQPSQPPTEAATPLEAILDAPSEQPITYGLREITQDGDTLVIGDDRTVTPEGTVKQVRALSEAPLEATAVGLESPGDPLEEKPGG